MMFLLDTNTVSHLIRKDNPIVERQRSKADIRQLAVSAITEGELRFGVARRPEAVRLRALIEEFLLEVTILPWDSDAARGYAGLRANLERQGRTLGSLDKLIAAHGIAAGATLVSSDSAFARIHGLKLMGWTKP